MRWLVVAALCACKSPPATEQQAPPPPRDAGPAPALPVPEPAFELPAPTDAIVDLFQADRSVCAVRKSGHVDCWSDGADIERLPDIADATKVRANAFHRCVVRPSEITCLSTGYDADKATPMHIPIAGAIDAYVGYPSCAVLADHHLACWDDDTGKVTRPRKLRDVVAIVGNEYNKCVVHAHGKVSCADEISGVAVWRPIALDHVRQLVLGEGGGDNGDFYANACARFEDGTVRCVEMTGHMGGPISVGPFARIDAASLRGASALAMQNNQLTAIVGGKVVVVGDGQPPHTLAKLTDAAAVTPSCALRAQGSVVCWGKNMLGQPFHGAYDKPVTVLGVANALSIATNERESWAVTRDGHVFHWGGDEVGWAVPLAEAHDTAEVVLEPSVIAVPCFLRRDGGVTCLSYREHAPTDIKLGKAVELRGDSDYIARLADGGIRFWSNGQIGEPSFKLTEIPRFADAVEVVGDLSNLCARDRAGAVRCEDPKCTWDSVGHWSCAAATPTKIAIPPAIQLAYGARAVCALLRTGEVSCWGDNFFGQLGRGDASKGSSGPGVVPGLDHVTEIGSHPTGFCAERTDGSLTCWGTQGYDKKPARVLPPGSLDGPFVGGANGCAIRKNGLVACWGDNGHGRVGDGSVIKLDVPAAVPGLR